ncbi:Uncharacterised protein [uncultured archaeon]|nr:Uncharacterised protein [uncultured archaeon]
MDLNEAWASTCRVLLHEEVGPLSDFGPYLKKYVGPVQTRRRSSLSNRPVTTADDDFGYDVRYISNSEQAEYQKRHSAAFDINSIKDLDSLLSTLQERFIYSGDVVLGKFHAVERSNRCSIVQYVQDSQDVSDCQYVAHCAMLRQSNYVFGSDCTGEIDYVIKNFQGWKSQRMLETTNTQYCSDVYFSANVRYCQECLFSFNQTGKRHLIGNLELPKDEYFKLKANLLAEMADELKRKKDIISIAELLGGPPRAGKEEKRPKSWNVDEGISAPPYFGRPADYPASLDSSFASTCQVLLGRPLPGPMSDYEKWLMRHVRAAPKTKSAMSGRPLWVLPILFNEPVRNTHVALEEAAEAGRRKLSEADAASLSLSNARSLLSSIALFTCEVALGQNAQAIHTVSYSDAVRCFASSTLYDSKDCAYGCWVSHNAERMFGCDHTFYSQSCIHAYRSLRLMRCLEVSDSLDSSDCYFCHHVENCQECLFCFNVKGKRFAIGNVELPREDFLRLKKLLLADLAGRLGKDKTLPFSIYSLGARGRS